MILRNAIAALSLPEHEESCKAYNVGYREAIRDAIALIDQDEKSGKSLFEKQCEAAKGTEGWNEGERELDMMRLRDEISAIEMRSHIVHPATAHKQCILDVLAIVDRYERSNPSDNIPRDEFSFANYICEAMDKWEAVNGKRRHDEARDAAASILEGIPERENPSAKAPPHLGIDGDCPLCEKYNKPNAETRAAMMEGRNERPERDRLRTMNYEGSPGGMVQMILTLVEAVDALTAEMGR